MLNAVRCSAKDRQEWRMVRSLLQSVGKTWHPSMVVDARGDRELPHCPESPMSLSALDNGTAMSPKLVGFDSSLSLLLFFLEHSSPASHTGHQGANLCVSAE